MILNSTLLTAFKTDTIPVDGDSNILIPPIIVPTIDLRQGITGSFGSSEASPYAQGVQRSSAFFALSGSNSNVAGTTILIGQLGPGFWELDIDFDVQVLSPAVGTFYGFALNIRHIDLSLLMDLFLQANPTSIVNAIHINSKTQLALLKDTSLIAQLPAVGVGVTRGEGVRVLANRIQ
jgi:hypothetical protein